MPVFRAWAVLVFAAAAVDVLTDRAVAVFLAAAVEVEARAVLVMATDDALLDVRALPGEVSGAESSEGCNDWADGAHGARTRITDAANRRGAAKRRICHLPILKCSGYRLFRFYDCNGVYITCWSYARWGRTDDRSDFPNIVVRAEHDENPRRVRPGFKLSSV